MGTRADFYVGVGPNAEWLGSVAYDGYRWGISPEESMLRQPNAAERRLRDATTEETFRSAVATELMRRDGTTPDMGWPWPWEDSKLTDYVYYFHEGKVHAHHEYPDPLVWPDMTARKQVTLGARSGLLILGGGNE